MGHVPVANTPMGECHDATGWASFAVGAGRPGPQFCVGPTGRLLLHLSGGWRAGCLLPHKAAIGGVSPTAPPYFRACAHRLLVVPPPPLQGPPPSSPPGQAAALGMLTRTALRLALELKPGPPPDPTRGGGGGGGSGSTADSDSFPISNPVCSGFVKNKFSLKSATRTQCISNRVSSSLQDFHRLRLLTWGQCVF